MKTALCCLCTAIFFLAACSGTLEPTIPPLTLAPPPETMFGGDCIGTQALNDWLQISSFTASDFLAQVNTTATLPRAEVSIPVRRMVALRDNTANQPAPDCATEAQLVLVDAMNTAIEGFQKYINGDIPALTDLVADVNSKMDRVFALQNQLIAQLDTQFRQAAPSG